MNATTANGKGHDRYAHYQRLRIDWPHDESFA